MSDITSNDQLQRERDNWEETAAQFCRNMQYYQGLLDQIGALLGDDAYVADDGSRPGGILRAKLPELVAARLRRPVETKSPLTVWGKPRWTIERPNEPCVNCGCTKFVCTACGGIPSQNQFQGDRSSVAAQETAAVIEANKAHDFEALCDCCGQTDGRHYSDCILVTPRAMKIAAQHEHVWGPHPILKAVEQCVCGECRPVNG